MEKRFTIEDILPPSLTEGRGEIMETAANAVVAQIQQWYASKPEDYFDGPNHPEGTARSFMRGVQNHWFAGESDTNGFNVFFRHPRENGSHFGLLLHEYGGTITPKRARALAIPMNAEARKAGSPEAYEEAYAGGKLFTLKTENAAILAWKNEMGELIAAYSLRKSVTIPSLQDRRGHPAVPPDDDVAAWAHEALTIALDAADTL